MKLYEVPRNSLIKLSNRSVLRHKDDPNRVVDTFRFFHIDGAYSFCRIVGSNDDADIVNLSTSTDVEFIRSLTEEEMK
ncbi:hypothetical protein M0R19_05375 [Candidatus Pacearchaeota archaeon]|jgi:hypothetical protein|nr:hypothetical protein [Candidatus Pacearchaeota archaeon]